MEFDNQKVNRVAIANALQSLGYEIPIEGLRSWYKENCELLFSLFSGLLLLIGWVGGLFLGFSALLSMKVGDTFTLTLQFEKAGEITVQVEVKEQ